MPGPGGFVEFREHMNPVFSVNQVFVRSGVSCNDSQERPVMVSYAGFTKSAFLVSASIIQKISWILFAIC